MRLFTEEIHNLEESDNLIIVDVQKEFSDFIPQGYIEKLALYCKDFLNVYQIWDANKASKPSYKFPNEKLTIKKKYGIKKDSKKYNTFNLFLKNNLSVNDYKYIIDNYNNLKSGEKFKFKNGYLIHVNNNHGWFYCNKQLTKLFSQLSNKSAILVGGGDGECIDDIEFSLKAFNVKTTKNHKLIYSSKTNDKQKVSPIPA